MEELCVSMLDELGGQLDNDCSSGKVLPLIGKFRLINTNLRDSYDIRLSIKDRMHTQQRNVVFADVHLNMPGSNNQLMLSNA